MPEKSLHEMNRNIALVVIGGLVLVGVVGSALLLVFRPDATATFMSNLTDLLGWLLMASGILYGMDKQGRKIDNIEQQTNGRLTKRDAEISLLRAQLAEQGQVPVTDQNVTVIQPRQTGTDHVT